MENDKHESYAISVSTALLAAAELGLFAVARKAYRHMNKMDLENKVVLITGGSRGLGLSIARKLASKKAKIAICSRTEEQLKNAESELLALGAEVLAIKADMTNETDVKKMITEVTDYFGKIDVLINNAGVMLVGPENVMEITDYKEVMDSNLWSALYAIKASVPHFKRQGLGQIVNICSIGGKIAVPHMLPYSVSKFAMVGLSQGLAAELKKDNIHVTTVIPNLMRTGSPRNVSIKGDHESEYAWFKFSDSFPLLSQSSESAASRIVEAIENSENEVVLTLTGKMVVAAQAIAPDVITSLAQIANSYMPESQNTDTKKGFESESSSSDGLINSLTDEAATANNEV